jgi:hypothetical protein
MREEDENPTIIDLAERRRQAEARRIAEAARAKATKPARAPDPGGAFLGTRKNSGLILAVVLGLAFVLFVLPGLMG